MSSSFSSGKAPVRLPVPISGLQMFGHSFLDNNPGPSVGNQVSTDNCTFGNILGAVCGLDKSLVVNHAANGARMNIDDNHNGGFPRLLAEIYKPSTVFPFTRAGGCYLICLGCNDVTNETAGNQAAMRADFDRNLTAVISKMRASAIFLATSAQWAFGTNFATSPTTAVDFTSGLQTSKIASVVDSAGTSTATFTIPQGYHGEPICFNLVGLSAAGPLTVTWGGTVTGTTSIVGRTDTLTAVSIQAHCAYPVRFTSATNGLSQANAGQTISVRITTATAGSLTVDGCWIEAWKPAPVLVCNVSRPAMVTYLLAAGDGVTTGVNTSFTSNIFAFNTAQDAGQAIVETDAQGAFTAGKTISSVTNATTIVLSGNAAAAKTSIQFTVARKTNGYSSGSVNTNVSGATVASHSAADADIDALSAQIVTTCAKFGSMVQVVDMNGALYNGDSTVPSNLYTWTIANDGLHPNDLGHERIAEACIVALQAMKPESDNQPLGYLEVAGCVARRPGPDRRIILSGQVYLPEFTTWGSYTAVAGDMFAMPIFFTESTVEWGATQIELTNTPTTGSSMRFGIYNDTNLTGYPKALCQEVTALTVGTTTGVRNPGSFSSRVPHYGLFWMVAKMDVIVATAPILRAILGPNRYMPNWSTAGGALTNMAWKLTGQGAGSLPTYFPAGAALTSTAPAFSMVVNLD